MMADLTGEFGPVSVSEFDGDLPTQECTQMKYQISDENKAIKIGYERIKQKVEDVR